MADTKEVISSDGVHVGTADKVEGNRIKLTEMGSEGYHRFVDLNLVARWRATKSAFCHRSGCRHQGTEE